MGRVTALPMAEIPQPPRQFAFARDTFAFANETRWNYHFDPVAGKTTFSRRDQKIEYSHRCFVMTRAARQFFYHARFDPDQNACDEESCCQRIREVLSRNPRLASSPEDQVVFPGWPSLRAFSEARAPILKATCGGAWRSYVLRSHWRMVFPISRTHQAATAASLLTALQNNVPPIIHLVKFPALTINHSMLIFSCEETPEGCCFQAYDPNIPVRSLPLTFHRGTNTFSLPQLHYWAGGELDIIEIFRHWWM